jgi:uncharacterized protein (DUF608 family)
MYQGASLSRVAYPMGGMGAGMLCLEGTGALSHFSLRNRPDVFHEPGVFAALSIQHPVRIARVLEGPVPAWKLFGRPESGRGAPGTSFGLPRFCEASFDARFPFGRVVLTDPAIPLKVEITGWSPFVPNDADSSSLPVAALEYRFANRSGRPVAAVFSFNARSFMGVDQAPHRVDRAPGGFALWGTGPGARAWDEGSFSATVSDADVVVNHAWFRGGWYDPLTMAWKDIAEGRCPPRPPVTDGPPASGASLYVPMELAPGAVRTIVVRLAWYVGRTDLRIPRPPGEDRAVPDECHVPWYAGRFADLGEVTRFWSTHYAKLRTATDGFTRAFHDSTLPPEVTEAVGANLTILKSPTVLRQVDGRFGAWEGCGDAAGSCHGTCTHVWNYAQALAHLFPALERGLRETEFRLSQNAAGHQSFRAALPVRAIEPDFHAAADGQLGGIMKVHRDWRISGDTAWLRGLWPRVRASLDYCIGTWDPDRKGWLEEPHHNTYDIEFWGPNGMGTSCYLGALQAAVLMGRALGDDISGYESLLQKGRHLIGNELFNGDYFVQRVQWKNLRAKDPANVKSFNQVDSPEGRALLEAEGPRHQYGGGCLSDGIVGEWLARTCGVGPVLDARQVASHLGAVYRHNFKTDLSGHANPQRPGYACGREGGLLLCTWPQGDAPSLPFIYSNEVWTGIEYQVASHLMMIGRMEEGLAIVRTCRARYDGRVRNPFNEYEYGHWYARALASYALLQGMSGARYDAVDRILHLHPAMAGDFRCFLATAGGFATVGVREGRPFVEVRSGRIEIEAIRYTPRK